MLSFHVPTSSRGRLFHEDMVLVRSRDNPAEIEAFRAAGRIAASDAGSLAVFDTAIGDRRGETVGAVASDTLDVFSKFAERGIIEQVVPIRRPTQRMLRAWDAIPPGPRGVAMGLALATAPKSEERPSDTALAGSVVIKLKSDEEARRAFEAATAKPTIDTRKIPCRFLSASPTSLSTRSLASLRDPWPLQRISWAKAVRSKFFKPASDLNVAVLDTGIDHEHPLLRRVVANRYHWDYPGLGVVSSSKDYSGHGTHVAGTIAADKHGQAGVRGLCDCRLHVWKIFSDKPVLVGQLPFVHFGYVVEPTMYLNALGACLDEDVDVINLSIGGEALPSLEEQEILSELVKKGVAIVAAMGNDREIGSPASYPAAFPGVIAVGASDRVDRIAPFSNRGQHVMIAAPGVGIWSTAPTYDGRLGYRAIVAKGGKLEQGTEMRRPKEFAALDGTSMAAPHVTAAIAMFHAAKGKRDLDSATDALRSSADRTPDMGALSFNQDFGFGRLNLEALLARVATT